MEDMRHAVHGRHELPVHQAPARAGQGAGGADRRRPDPGRHPDADRGAAGRRRGATCRRCCRCCTARPTGLTWRSTRRRWATGARRWPPWRTPSRDPIAPQYLMRLHRRAGRRRRDPDLRLAARSPPGRRGTGRSAAAASSTCPGNLATMAPGPAVRDRASSTPTPAGRCIAFVGDGGFAMLMAEFLTAVPVRPADQGGHQQQQRARADPVGADGARLPRARRPVRRAARRLRRLGRAPAAASAPRSTSPATLRRRVERGAGIRRARRSWTSTSTRTSRRCPARSPTSRPRSSPRRSCAGQPHKAAIATTLFKDKITQLKG